MLHLSQLKDIVLGINLINSFLLILRLETALQLGQSCMCCNMNLWVQKYKKQNTLYKSFIQPDLAQKNSPNFLRNSYVFSLYKNLDFLFNPKYSVLFSNKLR